MSKKTNASKINRVTAYAALGCFVSLTTPPKTADHPYYQVVVRNQHEIYSTRYRVNAENKARQLANLLANERGIQIIEKAAPERPVIHPPQA